MFVRCLGGRWRYDLQVEAIFNVGAAREGAVHLGAAGTPREPSSFDLCPGTHRTKDPLGQQRLDDVDIHGGLGSEAV